MKMPPAKNKSKDPVPGSKFGIRKFFKPYLNKQFVENLIFNPHYLYITCIALFIFEVFLNIFIIERVPYTEIDWIAYMQEVEGLLNGTLDYSKLKGGLVN